MMAAGAMRVGGIELAPLLDGVRDLDGPIEESAAAGANFLTERACCSAPPEDRPRSVPKDTGTVLPS